MHAVRENRYIVLPKDFEKGYKNNIKKEFLFENGHMSLLLVDAVANDQTLEDSFTTLQLRLRYCKSLDQKLILLQ